MNIAPHPLNPDAVAALMWAPLQTVSLAGIAIATASRQMLTDAMVADCLGARAAGGGLAPRLVFDANGHGVSLHESDPDYRAAVDQADVVHADGGFLITASKLLTTAPIRERSATTDMIHDFAAAAERHGLSFYLLGGTEAVNKKCAARLMELYPKLRIAGRRDGFFGPDEEPQVVEAINAAKPDVLWVGLGKPKEQAFSIRHRDTLKAGWLVTCGGCYNYVTGAYKRAPQWMQRTNLEWLHRAATEPRKLLWRYLTTTPHALWLVLTRRRQAIRKPDTREISERRDESFWKKLDTVKLGGVEIVTASRVELAEAMLADCVAARAIPGPRTPRLVFSANGQALSLRATDPDYRAAVDQADLTHADGGFLVTASRLLTRTPIAERSATTDMIHDLAAPAAEHGLSFYLLGGTEEVNAACAERLQVLYPTLRIVGRRNGYFNSAQVTDVLNDINAAQPDILWVGLGKPREQLFSVKHRHALQVTWLVTCGGCFNFVTGHYRRAPQWMQRMNLEWVHRAATEPRKLLWRYVTTTPRALWLVAARRAR